MVKAIKVMLIPNNVQKTKMFQYAGASRFAYNWALAREKENYEKDGKFISDSRHLGKKVLLVEDNELNREIATALLEEIGISVGSVEDGTDAVERMNEVDDDRYDLIFMDIQMPKMDGYMATREIRTLKNNKKANIPIIAMTANTFEEDREKSVRAGMNAHITKPIDIETIVDVLDQVFGTS